MDGGSPGSPQPLTLSDMFNDDNVQSGNLDFDVEDKQHLIQFYF